MNEEKITQDLMKQIKNLYRFILANSVNDNDYLLERQILFDLYDQTNLNDIKK